MKKGSLFQRKLLKVLGLIALCTAAFKIMECANSPELLPEKKQEIEIAIHICVVYLMIGIMANQEIAQQPNQTGLTSESDPRSKQENVASSSHNQTKISSVIKLKIDYGAELIKIAKTGEDNKLKAAYNKIPEKELPLIAWKRVFETAARNGKDVLRAIDQVAAKQKEKFSECDWRFIIAYAEINGDDAAQMALDIIPDTEITDITSYKYHRKDVDFLKNRIIENEQDPPNPCATIKTLAGRYQKMSEDDKLIQDWPLATNTLTRYCQKEDVSIEQIFSAINLVSYCITEVNQLKKERGQELIEPIIVRAPEEVYYKIKSKLEDYKSFASSCKGIWQALKYYDPITESDDQTVESSKKDKAAKIKIANMGAFAVLPKDIIQLISTKLLADNNQRGQ